MVRTDDGEVPVVERGDGGDVKPLGDGDDTRVDEAEPEIGVGLDQLHAAEVVGDGEVDHLYLTAGDKPEEAGLGSEAEDATVAEAGRPSSP